MGNEASSGGGGGGGSYNDHASFGEAFAHARRDLGAGKTFSYGGKDYSTNRADGRDLHAESLIRRAFAESVMKHENDPLRCKGGDAKLHKDSLGKDTIGFGHLITEQEKQTGNIVISGKKVNYKSGLTNEQAKRLFSADLDKAIKDSTNLSFYDNNYPNDVKEVLTEMTFQMGKSKVEKFVNMKSALKAGDYSKTAKEMLKSEWAKQTPMRAKVLAKKMENASN